MRKRNNHFALGIYLAGGSHEHTELRKALQYPERWKIRKVKEEALEGSAIRRAPGLVNVVPAVADHFCLNLPAAGTQPVQSLLAEPGKSSLFIFLQEGVQSYDGILSLSSSSV